MSWNLTKKVRLICGSRRDQEAGGELESHEESETHFAGPREIKRREMVLDPYVSPEEIRSRELELVSKGLTSFASVVTQQQCYGHCPYDCSAQQLKQQLRSTLVATQWRGDIAFKK